MKNLILLMIIGLFSFVLAACGSNETSKQTSSNSSNKETSKDSSSEIREMKIRIAHNMPIEHHTAKGVQMFADLISEKSGGKIKVSVFPSGQLYDDKSIAEAVTSGQIEMGMNTFTMWAGQMPASELYSLPLFPTYEAIHKGLDNGINDIFLKELNKLGAQPLMWVDYGGAYYASTKEPLSTPGSYKGKRVRVLSPLGAKAVELAGGTPVTMGGGEVDQALQRGTIDAASSGVTSFASRQYYQYTKYFVKQNSVGTFLLSTNLIWWNKLSDEEKKVITEAASEAQSWITSEVQKQEAEAIKTLESKGMKSVEVDYDAFKEIDEQLIQDYIKRTGEVGKELVEISKDAMKNN
jgi:TRAP-type C4-dicarboxylate transport system substrate-binding protein